jgi:hypothetical protein
VCVGFSALYFGLGVFFVLVLVCVVSCFKCTHSPSSPHASPQIRRYKIMNPDKLRASYGKLLYLLQDAASDEVSDLLGFDVVAPIKTVQLFFLSAGLRCTLCLPGFCVWALLISCIGLRC